jgi:hypothetical protein
MKWSKFPGEQVGYALRQAEPGTPVGDVCRQMGINARPSRFPSGERVSSRSSVGPRGIGRAGGGIRRRSACGFGSWRWRGPDLASSVSGSRCGGKAGWSIAKRVRLYRLEGLQVRMRVRHRKHCALRRGPAPAPQGRRES